MPKQASGAWKRLRRSIATRPERLDGGAAASDPLGLLAVELERLAAPQRRARPAAVFGSGGPGATGINAIEEEELPSWT